MKLKKLILFTVLSTIMVISSCSDDDALSPVNQTRISEANAFETPARVDQQVLGMYAGVKAGNFMGGRYYVYQDIRGEEFLNEKSNQVTNSNTWFFSVASSTSEVNNFWQSGYFAINRCNVVIKGLETSPIDAALKTQYLAEARFLRALTYYSLVTLYARPYWDGNGSKLGIPLRLNAETSSGNSDIIRATVGQVYDQIMLDLDFAETNLPLTYTTTYNRTTRAHKNTAIALKTRVLLSKRDYPGVVTQANKIVSTAAPFSAPSGGPNSLVAAITAAFAPTAQTTENVFSFAFSASDAPGTQNWLGYYWSTLNGNNGEYSLLPTSIIANTGWKSTDSRRAFLGVVGGKTYLQTKWQGGSSAVEYMQVIRYAEVLLNLSEATVRSSNTIDTRAVALLNAVRQRSDASTSFTVASFASVQSLLDQIAIERRIEFLGEGFRSLDVMRLGQDFAAKGGVPSVSVNANEYIWPIPQNELLYNKLATQNPGY
ncbi:RagB/SusD family nutrient uptake outer membrane protein [Lutibacter sp.]|uniref:RagB/SusD family nutrient uptake outer membrane protein n=1 Tax=Lutibacter sp. TaxID=1925666 RepID=UPI002736FDFC|nr:RagB/SusD family nutrient uptake outer membrane protein [Lutibacter sp.]MDP3311836.1 RagB/SusD family nutrient uptake outer membrane protein [Lutibacter sp.]